MLFKCSGNEVIICFFFSIIGCSNIPIICNQIGGNLEIFRITRPIEIKSIVMVLGWYIIKPVFFVVFFYIENLRLLLVLHKTIWENENIFFSETRNMNNHWMVLYTILFVCFLCWSEFWHDRHIEQNKINIRTYGENI